MSPPRKAAPPAAAPARDRGLEALLGAGLAVGTLAVFAPVFTHGFVSYDDLVYIVENPNLRSGLGLESARHAFTSVYETNWIPLTWLSLQLDYALFGLDPAGYHGVNLALHAASSVLLFLALTRMSGAPWPSAFTAAVFAWHPLHVESVAWATERKDVLSGLFWMLTVLCHVRYVRRPSIARYAATLLTFALGLLAKPMLVTLPFALLLLDYWPLRRFAAGTSGGAPAWPPLRRAVIEKLPMLALAALVSVVTVTVQGDSPALSHGRLLPDGVRFANAVDAYAWYVWKAFWPTDLAVFYPHPLAPPRPATWLWLGAGLALTAGALRAVRRAPQLAVGWLWFLGTLIPVIGVVQAGMQARADRYTYVPLIGLAILVAWSGASLIRRLPAARWALIAGAFGALALLGATARSQLAHWRDSLALYERAIEVTEDNYLAQHGLAVALLEAGELEAAEARAREAVRLRPSWPDAQVVLGDVLAERGDPTAALARYRAALELDPDHARAHANFGVVLIGEGRAAEAIAHLQRALELQRDTGFAHLHALLGQALAREGDLGSAIRHYAVAIEQEPEFAPARANLAFALIRAERPAEALHQLEEARTLGLDTPEVWLGLAEAASALGQPAEAVASYRAALERRPDDAAAANNLAWLLATRDGATEADGEEAAALAEVALARAGRDPGVLDTLAAAHARAGRFERAAALAEEALAGAREAGEARFAASLRARIGLYQSGLPYTELPETRGASEAGGSSAARAAPFP